MNLFHRWLFWILALCIWYWLCASFVLPIAVATLLTWYVAWYYWQFRKSKTNSWYCMQYVLDIFVVQRFVDIPATDICWYSAIDIFINDFHAQARIFTHRCWFCSWPYFTMKLFPTLIDLLYCYDCSSTLSERKSALSSHLISSHPNISYVTNAKWFEIKSEFEMYFMVNMPSLQYQCKKQLQPYSHYKPLRIVCGNREFVSIRLHFIPLSLPVTRLQLLCACVLVYILLREISL